MAVVTDWMATVQELGERFASRAAENDREGRFVAENYADMKAARLMSVAIPEELGGGGVSHSGLCRLIRELARFCPSTALAYSMHSHLVAATVWKYVNGKGGEPLLRRVADEQIVLLSTGGSDWVESNGTLTKVDGGYRFNAFKIFGSGSPAAEIMITSARYEHPEEGTQVLHFPFPMNAEGVEIQDDWDSFGMRGTGSNNIVIKDAFVPEESIVLTRPAEGWHPVWSMVVGVAFPVFLAPYLGCADAAASMALAVARNKARDAEDDDSTRTAGEMSECLMRAELAWEEMVRTTNDYDFTPSLEVANRVLLQKGILASACIETVQKAMTLAGGRGYYRGFGLEKLLRDVMAISYHPLMQQKQDRFCGRVALGLEPMTGEVM